MTVSDALHAVNALYVPGVVKYYAALSPDPWMQAHDELERAVDGLPLEEHSDPCQRFVGRCRELVERFKREGRPSVGVSIADAAALADDKRVRSWQARKGKYCLYCEATKDLTLQANAEDATQVDIVCRTCLAKGRKSA